MPFTSFSIDVPIDGQRLVDGLKPLVSQSNWLGLPQQKNAPFIGKVHRSSFRVMRVVKGRDSFNPVLYGRFAQGLTGTHLKVIMTFHPFVWVFIIAWTCAGLHAALVGLDNAGIPLFMVLALWVMAVLVFYYDVPKSRKLLNDCIGHIVEKAGR